jgi:hypothetical protein
MKRIVSLLAVLCVVSSGAYAGDGGASDSGSTNACVPPEEPPMPTMPEGINLDAWDFAGTPLMPVNTMTRSMYLVAFQSPADRTRVYVYGIDVASRRFIFAGTLSQRLVPSLTQRAGIDIGHFQVSGAMDPSSGISIQIEGPPPPPPPPNIYDPGLLNMGKLAWHVAVLNYQATANLHQ